MVSQKPSHPHRVMNIDAPLATARPGDPERRARQLRSLIERFAPTIERDRALPQELLAALFDASLFKMLLPRSWKPRMVSRATRYSHDAEPVYQVQPPRPVCGGAP